MNEAKNNQNSTEQSVNYTACCAPVLSKDRNHDHYWIDDDVLYESYRTLRGLRYRPVLEVFGMPNCEKCTDAMIIYIEKQYLS
jgi:hypothetical protein